MSKNFSTIVERAISVQGARSTSQFARDIGIQQSTLDLYLKGKRKPSIELVYGICQNCGVSADWLLGLSEATERNAGVRADSVSQAKLEGLKAAIRSLLDQY